MRGKEEWSEGKGARGLDEEVKGTGREYGRSQGGGKGRGGEVTGMGWSGDEELARGIGAIRRGVDGEGYGGGMGWSGME